MHIEARRFLDYCYKYFESFYKGKALDVGSGDINGTNKSYFNNMTYIGCDIFPSNNVDIVSKCHELPFNEEEFDIIISSECFEHDMYWEKSISKIMSMLKQNGLFVFTCASTGRGEHGTRRTSEYASLTTKINDDVWADYYKNLTERDILSILGFSQTFPFHRFYYNNDSKDLYFVGIKGSNVPYVPDYLSDYKILTHTCIQMRKTVVVYVYHEFNTNVDVFLKHGVFESDFVDFIFVCNGNHALALPQYKNVSMFNRPNIGHDFGGWSDAIFKFNLRDKYDYFILINSTVRGPLLPPWSHISDWTQIFTRLIDFETKLAGTTIGIVNGVPILQSMVLCFDNIGLDVAIKENIFIPNPIQKSKFDVVMENELGFSKSIFKHGYKIRSIMSSYYKTNLSNVIKTKDHIIQHCSNNGYFGVNLHPYELVFIKDNVNINNNLDIDSCTRHLLNGFDSTKPSSHIPFKITPSTPMSIIPSITPTITSPTIPKTISKRISKRISPNIDSHKNDENTTITDHIFTKKSNILIRSSNSPISKIPDDFDWKQYVLMNPDIKKRISTEDKAKFHWTHYGWGEHRKYKNNLNTV